MTALEFIAAGGRFERRDGRIIVHGPAERADLFKLIKFELATRVRLVGDGPDFLRMRRVAWCCDVCEDLIGCARDGSCPLCGLLGADGKQRCRYVFGGTCELCELARQKALELKREREGRAA